ADGPVGEYLFGTAAKERLLRAEGVDLDAVTALARRGVRYLASDTTGIVCFPTCRDAKRIREENRVPFRGAEQAKEKGFRPCLHCQPFAA
ncbi:MAG TPA: Ada metal-binding domain-containing protein, partial [Thermoanaerobaculia bacterium]